LSWKRDVVDKRMMWWENVSAEDLPGRETTWLLEVLVDEVVANGGGRGNGW
jgi:hypothetical protein